MLGESKTEDLTDSMFPLDLRFGERERNDEMDFVGLDGREAKAFGNDCGVVLRWIVASRWVFEAR